MRLGVTEIRDEHLNYFFSNNPCPRAWAQKHVAATDPDLPTTISGGSPREDYLHKDFFITIA